MKYLKFIFAGVLAVGVLILFIFPEKEVLSNTPDEEVFIEKELTWVDSLIIQYDSLLTAKMDSLKTVGAAFAITYKGEIVHLKCYGVKESGSSDSINMHTLFRLASVSKPITGVLAGILSDEGVISIDDKIVNYLPNFRLKDSLSTAELSIRNILSHSSGLVPHAYDNLVEAHVPFNVIMDSLFRVNISDAPGRLYGYQNVVFSLYDTISSLRTAKRYGDLLNEKVFSPFGMSRASVGFSAFAEDENKALPHSRYGNGFKTLRLNDRYYNTIPAAGINASIYDLGKFLSALSGNDSVQLDENISKEVLSPQVRSPLRWNYLRHWGPVESKDYALGWRVIGYQGRQIGYHGGYVLGYRAEIALCREEEIGIAFLTNSPNGVGSYCVPMFLDMYFERKKSEDDFQMITALQPE